MRSLLSIGTSVGVGVAVQSPQLPGVSEKAMGHFFMQAPPLGQQLSRAPVLLRGFPKN